MVWEKIKIVLVLDLYFLFLCLAYSKKKKVRKKKKSTQPIRICTDLFARFFKTSFKKSSFKILQFYANTSNFVAPARFRRAKPLAWLKTIKQTKKQSVANKNLALIIFLKFIPRASETGLRRMLEKISERNFWGYARSNNLCEIISSDWQINLKKNYLGCFSLVHRFFWQQKKWCKIKNSAFSKGNRY